MTRMAIAKPLDEILEKDLAAQVVELAKLLGWLRYHTYRSERSPAGFPDEVLVRDRVVYLELKREHGKLSPLQAHWLRALTNAGAEAYVIRPRNVQALASVLGSRRDPVYQHLLTDKARRAETELREELRKEIDA